ncbi:MAG: hypothetical protein CMH79_00110 [Nitrospinae bacterium]|nr:hypothetical protein [Nitrospinota bacterium]MBM32287.1 hypothetical protein [Chloroflexota bacterium]|tara:strand:- start:628 stop:1515 length:888 start_codon:yes stop_codon:yes gene_type:complete
MVKNFLYILNITLPVIILLAIGFLYASKKKINPKTLTDIVLFLLAPALIFHTLSTQNLDIQNIFAICFFSLAILLIPGFIATLIKRILKINSSVFVPTIMIMNSVSLPFPLAFLAFGEEGLSQVVLLSIPQIFVTFTIGIIIYGGRSNLKEPFRMPVLYASIIGILIAIFKFPVPIFVEKFAQMTGRGMFPLELFALGYRLRDIRISDVKISLLVSFLRFTIGFATAFLLTEFFTMNKILRACIFLVSCSPPAVLNYVFAERYTEEGRIAASIVFTGTIFSLITTPLLILYLSLT